MTYQNLNSEVASSGARGNEPMMTEISAHKYHEMIVNSTEEARFDLGVAMLYRLRDKESRQSEVIHTIEGRAFIRPI